MEPRLFERLLVPLDGSPLAEAVLSPLAPILRRKDAEVILLRVVPGAVYPYAELPVVAPDPRLEAKGYVQAIADRLGGEGARVRAAAEEGPPAGTILDVAERERVTLIAMATHGRTGLSRWAFGSVTEKVLRAAEVPVLVLRSFDADRSVGNSGTNPFDRILVPVVASHLGILPHVGEFARLFGSRVLFFHVAERGEAGPDLGALARELRESGVPAETALGEGDPAREILEACARERASLIAITTHGRRGPARWALGSVTEKVLRSATVPLLVVRSR